MSEHYNNASFESTRLRLSQSQHQSQDSHHNRNRHTRCRHRPTRNKRAGSVSTAVLVTIAQQASVVRRASRDVRERLDLIRLMPDCARFRGFAGSKCRVAAPAPTPLQTRHAAGGAGSLWRSGPERAGGAPQAPAGHAE